MTTPAPPTGYPDSWRRGGAPGPKAPAAPAEAVALAVDSYVAALSPDEFDRLVQRTRGGQ